MQSKKRSLLCIDDNEDNLELLTIIFEQAGFKVTVCNSLDNCLSLIRQNDYTAIILDNWFSDGNSLDICRKIRSFNPIIPIIFYSAEVRETEIEKALKAGANVYLTKPEDFGNLTATVNRIIQATSAAA